MRGRTPGAGWQPVANIAGLSYTWTEASNFGQYLAQSGMQTVLHRVQILE